MSPHRCDAFGVDSGACAECGAPYPGRQACCHITEAIISRELARLMGRKRPVPVELIKALSIDPQNPDMAMLRTKENPGVVVTFDARALEWCLDEFSDRIIARLLRGPEDEPKAA